MSATLDDLWQLVGTTTKHQLPVYRDSIDHILGILPVRELFNYRSTPPGAFDMQSVIVPPLLTPETKYAADLLDDMRAHRCHTVIVVDEYGGTAGIVTLKDLLEALVGRIDDKTAQEDKKSNSPAAVLQANGSLLLDGLMRVTDFEEAASLRLPDDARKGVDTLGGVLTSLLGRFPAIGEDIVVQCRALRVEGRDGLRVSSVRLLPQRESTAGQGSDHQFDQVVTEPSSPLDEVDKSLFAQ